MVLIIKLTCFLCAMGIIAILLAVDIFYTYKIAQIKGE